MFMIEMKKYNCHQPFEGKLNSNERPENI